jgi:hypothetical protein
MHNYNWVDELKPPTLGIISEILLVAGVGVLLLSWGGTQFSVGCGLGVYNCGSYAQLELLTFYLALVLLVASAVTFLFLLNAIRKGSVQALLVSPHLHQGGPSLRKAIEGFELILTFYAGLIGLQNRTQYESNPSRVMPNSSHQASTRRNH